MDDQYGPYLPGQHLPILAPVNGYTPHAIFHTIFLLQTRFRLSVPHIISSILDHAEYWVQTSSFRQETVHITENSPIGPYLSTSPITGLGRFPVRKVVFKIASHDQGWCDRPDAGNWTWFDVVADGPDRMSRKFERLYTNILADRNAKNWVVDMVRSDERSSDPEERRRADWIGKLRSGDVISVVPRALCPGWVNHVSFAKMDVYTACHL